MNSPLLEKSMDFATKVVLFYEEFSKSKKDTTIAKKALFYNGFGHFCCCKFRFALLVFEPPTPM